MGNRHRTQSVILMVIVIMLDGNVKMEENVEVGNKLIFKGTLTFG
jgi:hypothetical protein